MNGCVSQRGYEIYWIVSENISKKLNLYDDETFPLTVCPEFQRQTRQKSIDFAADKNIKSWMEVL